MKFLHNDAIRETIFTSLVKHVDAEQICSLDPNFRLNEGDVVAVCVEAAVGYAVGGGLLSSSFVEDRQGALRVLHKGAVVITVLGNRESTYWSVANLSNSSGQIMQLVSHAGLCSYMGSNRSAKGINVRVLGTLLAKDGKPLNIKDYPVPLVPAVSPIKINTSVFAGTSAEVGKTTALLSVLQALRDNEPRSTIVAIKMSGTPSDAEINLYKSYGASRVFNLIDVGFPTSYSTDIHNLIDRLSRLLTSSEVQGADHILIELGGDIIGGGNLDIATLLMEVTSPIFFLSAFDCFGAESCSRYLARRHIEVTAITGKCVANPIVRKRTADLCALPALSALDAVDLRELLIMHYRGATQIIAA